MRPVLARPASRRCRASRGSCRRCASASRAAGARRGALVERRPRVGRARRRRRVSVGQISIEPAVARRDAATWRTIGGFASISARRARVVGEDAVDRGEHRRHGAERQVERHARARSSPARAAMPREAPRPWRRTCSAPRPGSCRSTASRRRRRTACASRSRAPAPAKNSAASASMICHCSGARVLRLVDEDVVEAAVELEEHPRGGVRPRRAGRRSWR